MSAGVFQIVTNDGRQDNILMATEYLNQRLGAINQSKYLAALSVNPDVSPSDLVCLPTLLDIEKSHVLFTNAHFKPFAAIGFEYNKVNNTTGNLSWGQTLQFQIPQFGDFFSDIAFHVIIQQPTLTTTATEPSDIPAMRWTTYPGERLLKKVQQEVNGTVLDDYTNHATVIHREFRILNNKILSWNRCVGQQEAEEGNLRQPDWAMSGQQPANHMVQARVFTGLQTPTAQKTTQVEMFIPLLFWYNTDIRLAVPSVAIPTGQRNINIELATQAEIINLFPRGAGTWANPYGSLGTATISKAELYVNNIFMNPEIHRIYIKRVGFSLIRVHKQHLISTTASSDESLMSNLKWPIEWMAVCGKIRDYFTVGSSTLAQNLDAWDKSGYYQDNQYYASGYSTPLRQKLCSNDAGTVLISTGGALTGTGLLNGVLSPVFAANTGAGTVPGSSGSTGGKGNGGAAATAIVAGTRLEINGVRYGVQSLTSGAAGSTLTAAALMLTPAPVAAVSTTGVNAFLVQEVGQEFQTRTFTPCLTTLSIKAHGIELYKEFPLGFYSSYLTGTYGGYNLNTPKDSGTAFVTFCVYPGTYQPSGHINASRAREFYAVWASGVFGSACAGVIVIIASAINFLLISDGSAVLRYTT